MIENDEQENEGFKKLRSKEKINSGGEQINI